MKNRLSLAPLTTLWKLYPRESPVEPAAVYTTTSEDHMDSEELMVKEVEEHGVANPDAILDDLVHDTASRMASRINNGGVAEQVRYLFLEYGEERAKAVIREILATTQEDDE